MKIRNKTLRTMLSAAALTATVYCLPATAATFTVTNTSGGGPGSMNQAITDANAQAGTDTITFNIPGEGVHNVSGGVFTDPVIIDGYSQPGAKPNTFSQGNDAVLRIEISRDDLLHITAGNSTVRGLVISRAIFIEAKGSNVISGNFIGTDAAGTSKGAGVVSSGIRIKRSSNNLIGGTNPEARNLISGGFGVSIEGIARGNRVQGNYIGTDRTGTLALGNRTGVMCYQGPSGNTIGGVATGSGNLISGNDTGVSLIGGRTRNNVVQSNFIGTDVTGTKALGNRRGIEIRNAVHNTVGGFLPGAGNIIAFNRAAGVAVINGIPPSTGNPVQGNAIRGNSIFTNGRLGIDLGINGPTPNDNGDGSTPPDTDMGPNLQQNFPILYSAQSSSTDSTLSIRGLLKSTPSTAFRIEFFASPGCDPSGYGEGETFLGARLVTTGPEGKTPFLLTLPTLVITGQVITATATDPDGNTSEFSNCVPVTDAPSTTAVAL